MSNRPYAAGEHTQDPALQPAYLPEPSEGEELYDPAIRPALHSKQATGKHHPIRATSTEDATAPRYQLEGQETFSNPTHQAEPEDSRPDQLDHNR